MKRSTLNHWAMYQNVLSYVRENESEWNTIPKFVETVGQLELLLERLQEKFNFQAVKSLGVSERKHIYLNELITMMEPLKKGLFLLAKDTDNFELKERHKRGAYLYGKIAGNKLKIVCSVLLDDVNTFETDLAPYGVSSEMIQELRDKILLLEETNLSTWKAISEKAVLTIEIAAIEKQINELLGEKLDALVVNFKRTSESFYIAYKKRRKIIRYGKTSGRPVERDDGTAN